MSTSVRPFRSKAEVDAQASLARFIADARRSNPIGVSQWDALRWDFPKSSRASSASEGGVVFSLRSANTRDAGVMPEPFMSFVKAIVCAYNSRTMRPYAVGQSQTLVAAARLLHSEIEDRGGDPTALRGGDFEAAANKARERMGEGAANIGSKLAIISKEMDRHRLTAVPIGWRNGIRRDHKHDRVGAAATARRHEKLPPTATLEALAEISARSDLDDRDLIVQRAIDLLMCGGFRLNEVLTLPRNAIVEEPVLDEDGRAMLDLHGHPARRIGLRYWPEKGGHAVSQIKWMPTALVDVALRAIADITRITEPYAACAREQRDHPGATLLGEPWDSMDADATITTAQVAAAVGLTSKHPSGAGNQFVRENRLPTIAGRFGSRKTVLVRIDDLKRRLWERSIHGNVLNPATGTLDIADSLFTIPRFFVKRTLAAGMRGTVQLLSDAMVQVYLVSQANGNQPSIFERLDYRDETGEPMRLNSHQFRHLLNTLAAEGSVSEMEIARWMGRANIVQNAAYQHVTPIVRAESLRERLRSGAATGPVADQVAAISEPKRREEFIASTTATAHVTDLGFCVHPWDALPCADHGACASCSEHRIVKGDPTSRERAAADLEQTETIIAIARTEDEDGTWGADNWLAAHETTADALRRIVAVHDDDQVADGTLVQLPRTTLNRRGANDA